MSKQLKQWMAEDLKGRLHGFQDLLVVGLKPLDSEQTSTLRRTLRDVGATLRVVHNRTARHALDGPATKLGEFFRGQTAIALGREAIPLAKALVKASKGKQLEVRGGIVEGEILDAAGVVALAASPDKSALRSMLLSAILGPGRGLAVALRAVAAGLARCVDQRAAAGGPCLGAADAAPETNTTN
ncbi:MAG: 50S ribosomal protein L10 [Planctomycetaceae bacterium]